MAKHIEWLIWTFYYAKNQGFPITAYKIFSATNSRGMHADNEMSISPFPLDYEKESNPQQSIRKVLSSKKLFFDVNILIVAITMAS